MYIFFFTYIFYNYIFYICYLSLSLSLSLSSSIFIYKDVMPYDTLPSKPCGHSQTKSLFDLNINVQLPLFWQGFIAQASYSCSQLSPIKSLVQLHVYPLTRSMQMPPFWHGCDRHSSTLRWQFFPAKNITFRKKTKYLKNKKPPSI